MASKVELSGFESLHKPNLVNVFYINDHPVGAGSLNKWRADNQLVQFFLVHWFTMHSSYLRQLPGQYVVGKFMDGNCGPQTLAAIRMFQEVNKHSLAQDGLVSVPRGIHWAARHYWTVIALNLWCQYNKETNGLATLDIAKLEEHPLIKGHAPELYQELTSKPIRKL